MSSFGSNDPLDPAPYDPAPYNPPPALAFDDAPIAPRRIPNFGHAALFVAFAALLLFILELILVATGNIQATPKASAVTFQNPKLLMAIQAAAYVLTLLAAWLVYPLLWKRSFPDGIQWNWPTARSQASRLIALGLVLGAVTQVVTYFITPAKPLPIDDFFVTPSDAWIVTLFGTLIAPAFEEICFRGFLLPAFAIAYDWVRLPRTVLATMRWQTTTDLSPTSLIFSAILTSALFALLHFQQYAHLWGAMLVLFSVSIILTIVRLRTKSVAASTLVHVAYNLFDFLLLFIATGGYRHLDRLTH